MYSSQGSPGITLVGFPHSDISGSTPACGSPELFAANHVLHRLSMPRHPPCALSSLTQPCCRLCCLPTYGLKTRVQCTMHTDPSNHQDASRIALVTCNQIRVTARLFSFQSAFRNGGNGTRTRDPRLAKPMLYQLSYSPVLPLQKWRGVGLERLELSTPRLSSVCSNQLSYRPKLLLRRA
jgi:hypothetical protein